MDPKNLYYYKMDQLDILFYYFERNIFIHIILKVVDQFGMTICFEKLFRIEYIAEELMGRWYADTCHTDFCSNEHLMEIKFSYQLGYEENVAIVYAHFRKYIYI